jgi:hypothetical protein
MTHDPWFSMIHDPWSSMIHDSPWFHIHVIATPEWKLNLGRSEG